MAPQLQRKKVAPKVQVTTKHELYMINHHTHTIEVQGSTINSSVRREIISYTGISFLCTFVKPVMRINIV